MAMKEENDIPNAENPEIFTGIKRTEPSTVAGGTKAVINSLKHVFGEMSIPRGFKALAKLNQMDGHDCPGCAWPDPDDHRSGIAEYCENGAKAIAEEATDKALFADFFQKNSVAELAQFTDYEIGKKGRVAEPMYLPKGGTHYQPITWETALKKIASKLNALQSPNEAVFYTSGRTSNEAAFLYQLLVRQFGTNNLPDCSNMCHESSGVALGESVGIGKGSVKLEDFYEAEVIIILGQNPGTNHPRMMSALQKAKENGTKIISVNPIKETGLLSFVHPQSIKSMLGGPTPLTDLFLQVKINGDMALMKAINKLMLMAENKNPGQVFDQQFLQDSCIGHETYLAHLEQQNLEQLALESGVPLALIEEAAQLMIQSKKIIACWAMGLTQHKNAVNTIKEVVNTLLLKGSIGKPGAGTCPVRGHSNVQGDRTMGIYEKPSEKFLNSIQSVFGFNPPREHGYDVVECIHAMHNGSAKVFFAMGGNFLSATPDTVYTAEALRKCDLTVHVSTKLNRSHLIHGKEAIILPCLGRTDLDIVNGENQFVSVENSMGVVHSSKGNLKPVSEHLKSEAHIVIELAVELFKNNSVIDWKKFLQHNDIIRDYIEKTIPGFENYNQRVRLPGGFYLPNGSRIGQFNTLSGKAEINTASTTPISVAENELMMMTVRSHDQFNTTIYGLHDRYRGIFNERRVIFMNAKDINRFGFSDGEVVDLYNYFDGIERVARKFIIIQYDIPQQCCATYFPETNVLVPINSTADKSNTPTSKLVLIQIKKHKETFTQIA